MDRTRNSTAGTPYMLSWGAVIGGTLVAAGIWILLYTLGIAIGISAVDSNDMRSLRAAGIGTGVWSFIAPVLALLVGGLITARSAGFVDRLSAAIHGAVVWGLTMIVGLLLVGFALSALIGGMVKMGTPVQNAAEGLPDSLRGGIFWGLFLSLLFSLASAVLGAITGVSRVQRGIAEEIVEPPPTPSSQIPIT